MKEVEGFGTALEVCMLTPKVLFVDDDCHVLSAFRRVFRKYFVIDTALGGEAGLRGISERGPFSVIVSDLKMPGMDGIQFLSQVQKIAPESIGIILTGNACLKNVIEAVNEGVISCFLTKPCEPEVLRENINSAFQRHKAGCAKAISGKNFCVRDQHKRE